MSSIASAPAPAALTAEKTLESQRWFDRARAVLAGGISSSARATAVGRLGHPLYITHGRGSRIWDADGNEFVDFLLSYGSIILGHCDQSLRQALSEQSELGTMFGTCNMPEVELAEEIVRLVPCAELVRYANSGSEAMCGAVRAARGFTGRNKIIKFEGHYHGWVDQLAVSNRPTLEEAGPADHPKSAPHSPGIPRGVVEDVIICPWNEPEALSAILNEHAGEIAAVVAEPIVANNACIMPRDGYLEFLRQQCDEHGAVLIFDEIVTGFRVAAGGAQELFGVLPDIAVFSKAIGGGLPISAFAGRRQIMEMIGRNKIKHGGTYNGNPLCATAARVTLRKISAPGAIGHLSSIGQAVIDAIRSSAKRHGVVCTVQGMGSMFQVIFGLSRPAGNYRDLFAGDPARYAVFHQALLDQGIHANSSGTACWFVSLAHTEGDVEQTCRAIDLAMGRCK
ncbi:MAG TPA: glutamate-1-semialdehyde 2,1-aminomutase [Tepidisphaeraceae bacterium]|nr:glutamate-1-semialdehyde 2,1-aminomutase [Tepidisphaeraceae bacterium]